MTTAMTTVADILSQAQSLSREQIWNALPEENRTDAIRQELANAGPGEAVNIYKSCFWKIIDGSMQRLVEPLELLPLMIGIYLQKGGTEPEQEITMWGRLFNLEL